MADYKIVDAEQLDADLESVADSIRAKGGTNEKLEFPIGFKSAVDNIKSGEIPDGYIDLASVLNHCTKFACGQYQVGSDISISSASIQIGFKPKVFVLRNFGGIQTTANTYYVTTSFFVTKDNYEFWNDVNASGVTTNSFASMFTYYNNSKASAGQSSGLTNCFLPVDNGVAGNGNSSLKLKGGIGYLWFAWG